MHDLTQIKWKDVEPMIHRITFTFLLMGLCGYVYACKCSGPGTIKESFRRSDAVILGKVIKIDLISFAETIRPEKRSQIRERLKRDNREADLFDYKGVVKIELEIIDIFKGNISGDTVIIYTTMGGPSCGYDFKAGKEYIIYGFIKGHAQSFYLAESERMDNIENPDSYWTNRCTRTREYDKFEVDELRALRKRSDQN